MATDKADPYALLAGRGVPAEPGGHVTDNAARRDASPHPHATLSIPVRVGVCRRTSLTCPPFYPIHSTGPMQSAREAEPKCYA